MGSLQDQLLKAGMVDEKKLKQTKKEKRKSQKLQRKGQESNPDAAKVAAEAARKAQVERDRQLNQQRKEAAERKALQAQIRQLIEMNQVEQAGDIAYSFTDAGKIKNLYVTEKIQQQLSRGVLAIVTLDEQYRLVPIGVAEKIRQRDAARVLVCNSDRKEPDADDPYAEFQVPDDLMW